MGNLSDRKKEDSKSEHSARGGGFFKFKEGDNIIRILAEPVVIFKDYNHGICYTDCGFQGSMKYLTWVLTKESEDPKSWVIQLMEMPMTVFDVLAKWEEKKSTQFTEFPMPYDMDIDAENAGTKEVKYVAIPGDRDGIPENFLEDFKKKKTIPEMIQSMKEKNKEKHLQDGTWEKFHSESGKEKPSGHRGRGYEYPDADDSEIMQF